MSGPPTASAHRIDLAAAGRIAEQMFADDYLSEAGCSRRTDHRAACGGWYEDWSGDEPVDWSVDRDFVLIGSKLYACDSGRPCSKRALKQPITFDLLFDDGDPFIDMGPNVWVEYVARGAGGYFVPFKFDSWLLVDCKYRNGRVDEDVESNFEGAVRASRINAHRWHRIEGGRELQHLTATVGRDRVSGVASITQRSRNGRSCSGRTQFVLRRQAPPPPRYIKW